MEIAIFFSLLLLAEVLGTVGGFGSSMLVMPLAIWFLTFEQALGLTAVFHVFSNGAKMILFRKGMDRRLLVQMGIPAVIGVVLGARLTVWVDGRAIGLMLGVALLLMSAFLFLLPNIRIHPTRGNALVGGSVSGFVAGLVGTGGAVRGATLAAFGLDKNVFVATSAWIDMGVDLSRSVVYWGQGYLDARTWLYLPVLAAVSLVGSYFGKQILAQLDQSLFERIVLGLVFILGIVSVVVALR
ncbi:MAG: sulfite exporter TauE/SafE family protein [Flavobacteriales bacterium]|nr:sulfite exporter TauE/SafE family protein [Flavobacteriales bacterium]